ncbi:hypothetical protein [Bythopirellula polymerisocia]|uniref:Uncharacterized protein n=1 Tax=Bythopirellula polymerisocia TaxID=2528003 RepID=A0A5C6D1B3_9BACT|nr:hypothetical protein [Bythopirellula polymerisocia]TWU28689.1 hypothetical protein Pla144_19810 [Bythopirellula polymerisocia]
MFRVEFFGEQDVVIAPIDAELASVGGSYIQYGTIVDIETGNTNGDNWYNGSGLADPTIVETGDPIPAVWPEHISGNYSSRVSRIRNAPEANQLTFDLGGTFDVSGMVLWNSTEQHDSELQTDRGFENTRLSYSTDGGVTFVGSDLLTWTERSADASENQGGTPSSPVAMFGPEVQMLPAEMEGVTHIRMQVDNFSLNGSDNILMASEIRFIGKVANQVGTTLGLKLNTLEFTRILTATADFDSDNDVDGADFLAWQRGFGDVYDGVDLSLWKEQYGTGSVTAQLADFDSDNDVDGADFLAWQRGFRTTSATLADGDANLDGSVDGIDLSLWGTSYGQTTAGQVASVIEPSEVIKEPALTLRSTRTELIDAAMALEWISNEPKEEASFATEPMVGEAAFDRVYDANRLSLTNSAAICSEMLKAVVEEAADYDELSLALDLLDRAFG